MSRGVRESSSPFGGSWGVRPPLEEVNDAGEGHRRGGMRLGAKHVLSKVKLWKEQGLTPENIRGGMVSDSLAWGHEVARKISLSLFGACLRSNVRSLENVFTLDCDLGKHSLGLKQHEDLVLLLLVVVVRYCCSCLCSCSCWCVCVVSVGVRVVPIPTPSIRTVHSRHSLLVSTRLPISAAFSSTLSVVPVVFSAA